MDLATASRLPLDEITTDGELCAIDLLKEAIGPLVLLDVGPILALDDAVGLKVGALQAGWSERRIRPS